jgi:hypothetical protein
MKKSECIEHARFVVVVFHKGKVWAECFHCKKKVKEIEVSVDEDTGEILINNNLKRSVKVTLRDRGAK